MPNPLSDNALNQLFREARTHNGWQDKSVPETLVRAVYELTKMGPTSANCSPARFVFIESEEAKAKLKPHLSEGNRAKTMSAPWCVIVAHDLEFHEKIPQLFPHNPGAKEWFADPQMRAETAFRNGSLQGGYLMMAARAMGLDCGPMSGFDKKGVEETFLKPLEGGENLAANFLCNIGFGDETDLYPRSPRLSFEDACKIV